MQHSHLPLTEKVYVMPLVLVRTPTYRRPALLKRALVCLQSQTHQDWICEVRDDCPDGSAKAIVEELNDPRIHHVQNQPQKFMIENLDACFLKENPYDADYFFMLEDDNQVRPKYMEKGIEIISQMGVNICMLNQVIEYRGVDKSEAYSEFGILSGIYNERVHEPREIRLALFGWTAMSNGSIFWSKNIRRELAFRTGVTPGIDEDLRAMLLREPVYVCREKLAVWAQDEVGTTRNLGFKKGKLRRELDMQAGAKAIRRIVWKDTPEEMKISFLKGEILRIPLEKRQYELQRAGIKLNLPGSPYGMLKNIKVNAVRIFGRVHPSIKKIDLDSF